MYTRILATATFLIGLSNVALAQDKIYLRNGDLIEARVKEVDSRTVVYKRFNNQEGPDYKIGRNEIDHIRYENGTEEQFDHRAEAADERTRDRHLPVSTYGKNILSLALVQMTNESPAGLGLHYERMLDPKGIISLYIPLAVSLVRNDDYYNYYPGYGGRNRDISAFFYAYPGIKIYPTGSRHRIYYGVGPSIAFGAGTRYQNATIYDPNTGQYLGTERRSENVFKSGLIVNNSLNVQPTKNFYLGLELGLGFVYTDNDTFYDYNDEPLVQFNFKLGYRF